MTVRPLLSILLWLSFTGAAVAQTNLLSLAIGDPGRREREVSLELDTILSTVTDEIISPRTLAGELSAKRLILVGEQHTSAEFHAVQLRVLELLHTADVPLTVGLEMIPVDQQSALDAWSAGQLDEQAFLEASDWYGVWGYNWGYYRDIFLFARRHAIPMFALRASDDETQGQDANPVPPTNEQRELIAAFFESDSPVHGGLSAAQLDALVVAQAKRDAAMAQRIVQAIEAYPNRTMVVLAGTGHVLYGLGIVAQLPEAERSSAATILPVAVEADSVTVRASVADFVWGIPDADHRRYPDFGVITMQTESGLSVIHVTPESPASRAGLTAGDVLTHFAGTALDERRDLSAGLAALRWGDEVSVGIRRNDEREELTIAFRR